MSTDILLLLLLAAFVHALWNSWLKVAGDRLTALATLAVGWAVVALCAFPFVGAPAEQAWGYLAVSTVVHTVYSLSLIRAYRFVDLSVAYPIARGTGPLIVAVASAAFFGDALGATGFVAVLLIVLGVFRLSAAWRLHDYRGVLFSLMTGGFIGAYTLLDGLGGRIGGAPHAYAAWLFLLTAAPIVVVAAAANKSAFVALPRAQWVRGVAAGMLGAAAYWIVVWAMSFSPMGLVAAIRESSVVIAALIGGWMLGERVRWTAVMLVFAGVVLARLSQ